MSRAQLAKEFFGLKQQAAEYEKLRIEANKQADQTMAKLLEAMEEEDVSTFTDPTIDATFSISNKTSVKVLDNDAMFQWFKDNNLSDVIKETIHPSTRDAEIRRYVEETGGNVPGTELTGYQIVKIKKG